MNSHHSNFQKKMAGKNVFPITLLKGVLGYKNGMWTLDFL